MKRRESRDKIVEAARRLFYEAGFEQTSFADLAERSGIPKGNFYYHFRSKDELLTAVLDARIQHVRVCLEDWGQRLRSPQEKLRRFVRMMTSEETDLVQYGCPLGSLLTELGKRRADLREHARVMMDLYRDWLAARFVELGVSPRQASSLAVRILARTQGAVLMAQAYDDATLLRREVKDIESWLESFSGE